ncbi:MAG: HlyD family efflux transporter periplasmic adaptor subunit [Methanomassiliicoccales archaeon]
MTAVNNTRQQRIGQEKRRKQAGGLVIILIAGFLVFCVSHGIYRVIKDSITASRLNYQTAIAGEVEQGVGVKGIIIRPEKVVLSPLTGRFENVVLDGERVRQGTVVGHLYPSNGGAPQAIKAPFTGMVVFGVDGLELALANFDFTSCSPMLVDYQATYRSLAGAEITSGQPLLKIVDNLAPLRIVISFKLSAFAEPWESGKRVILSHAGKRYRADVTALKGSGGLGMALLTIPGDDQLGKLRTTNFTVVETKAQGVTIPTTALVQNGSGVGVYVLENGQAERMPVTIICQNQVRVVVDGINNGDLVLTNPERLRGAVPLTER